MSRKTVSRSRDRRRGGGASPGGESAAGRTARTAPAVPVVEAYEPPYLAALVAGLGVFALYALTLAPTTHFWDASEYIATAHVLGIAHPPGNPLFVVLARAWELLLAPTGLSVAVRVNLFSAFMGAAAHGLWFLVAHRVLAYYSPDRFFRLAGASVAVLIGAAAFTVWNQSNVNEKVYTVSLFTIALLSWLAFRWRDNLGRGKDDNLILLMVFVLALSVGNHLMAFLAAPALGLFILLVAPRTLTNWKLYAGAALVAAIGLSIHLFLPLRASLGPVINQADPSTWTALWESLTRQQYAKPSVFADPTNPVLPRGFPLFAAQMGNYLQYFDWQWARSVSGADTFFAGWRPFFTLIFTGLGLFGAWTHWLRDRISFAYVAALFLTLSVALVFYLNFRYGFSYPSDVGREMREVRERDYFFIVSFSLWGVWAGIGLAALWQRLASVLAVGGPHGEPAPSDEGADASPAADGPDPRRRGETARWRRAYLRASPVLLLALLPLLLNWSWASRAGDYTARDWAYNLLMSVEPYGVLFTNGDNDTFPLWYLQEVEGIRRDVQVLVLSYLNTPWYVRQARDMTSPCPEGVDPVAEDRTRVICQRPYVVEDGPDFYAELLAERGRPTRSIIGLADAEIDDVFEAYYTAPGMMALLEPLRLQAGELEFTVPAGPQGRVLQPAEYFIIHMVQNSLGDRPIHFAATSDGHLRVGLEEHVARQGLSYRVHERRIGAEDTHLVALEPGPLRPAIGHTVDLPRTEALLTEVFAHQDGPDEESRLAGWIRRNLPNAFLGPGRFPEQWVRWVDGPTQRLPIYYMYTHYAAAQAYAILGDDAALERHARRAEVWGELIGGPR